MSTAEIVAVQNPYEGKAFDYYLGDLTISVCQVPHRGNALDLPLTIAEVRQKPISETDALAIIEGAISCHAELVNHPEVADPIVARKFLGNFALVMSQIPGYEPEEKSTIADALAKTTKSDSDLRLAAVVALAITDTDSDRGKQTLGTLAA